VWDVVEDVEKSYVSASDMKGELERFASDSEAKESFENRNRSGAGSECQFHLATTWRVNVI
jgi:hypothetical protein